MSAARHRGPRLPASSDAAKKAAVAVLQVMSGAATPAQASEALAVSVNRYYQLESRALVAMMKALEPRPRGPGRDVERELEGLRREKGRAEREASRCQALLRLSQRAMGMLPRAPASKEGGAGRRKVRRPRVRAKAVIAAIGAAPPAEAAPATGEGGAT